MSELERLFDLIVEIPTELRQAKLEALCSDADLRQQVQMLLDADSTDDGLLDHSLVPETVDVNVGEQIDGYKLLQEIAVGGMGVVFRAEQLEPVWREVALKVIKPGVDTREVIARFDAERQALSMMDHPNIATVFDAGTTAYGRPYFVMELVRGQSITTYCDGQNLSVRQRLKLFLTVCHAIQHAHQKGIIHRDIKPSNILVAEYDGRPLAKVIDFGIAKAINSGSSDSSLQTHLGQIVGTFEYMSPEQSQVSQQGVDTRSDIYSLGVLLYELLTGEPPFSQARLRSMAWEEMLKIIREEDPPRPSARLTNSTNSNDKKTEADQPNGLSRDSDSGNQRTPSEWAKLRRTLRGELDWIVLKAMDKDRNRRYATPNALANDIECFINGDAVAACPPSRIYFISKFVKRHKGAIATTVIVAASLVMGLIGTTWQAIRARRANQAMQASAKETAAINEYFVNDLLNLERYKTEVSTGVRVDPNLRLDAVLERALKGVEKRFGGQDDLKANLKATLARSFGSIGKYAIAAELFEERLKYLKQKRGERDPETLEAMKQLVWIYLNQSRLVEAQKLCIGALKISREDLGEEHELTQKLKDDLATLLQEQGHFQDAEKRYRECLEVKTRLVGAEHPDTLRIQSNLALLYERMKKFNSAKEIHQTVLKSYRQQNPVNQIDVAVALSNLGRCQLERGWHLQDPQQFRLAVPRLEEALEICHEKLGRDYLDNPTTLQLESFLAQARCALQQYEKAELILVDLSNNLRRLRGSDHITTLETMNMLGWVYLRQNRLSEAEDILKKALEAGQPLESIPNWTIQATGNLAIVYRLMGKLDKSIIADEETLGLAVKVFGPTSLEVLAIKTRIGLNFLEINRIDDGRELLQDVLESDQVAAEKWGISERIAESYPLEDDAEVRPKHRRTSN